MNRRLFKHVGILVVVLLALPLLSACGAFNLISVSDQRAESATLAGTAWVFISFNDTNAAEAVLPGTPLTLAFDAGGQFSGFAGCNEYFGNYTVLGETIALSEVGVGGDTCNAAVMAQEQAFLDALGSVSSFSIQGMVLDLFHDSAQFLHFAEPESAPTTPLSNSRWTLNNLYVPSLGNQELLDGTTLTLMFSDDGRLSGFGGCNSFSGRYAVDDSELSVYDIEPTTDIPCKLVVRDQENEYLESLLMAKTFEVEGTALVVEYTFGQEMHYVLQR